MIGFQKIAAMVGRIGFVLEILTSPAMAQTGGAPTLIGINPPSLSVGRTTEWSIHGRNLGAVRTVLVSGPGVEVLEVSNLGSSIVKAKLLVDPGATPGYREVRVDGPDGVSNLAIVRVDTLHEVIEEDQPEVPQTLEVGSVVVGQLNPKDIDTYRIKGTPGTRVTLDLEARQVGLSMSPVMTILSDSGQAIAQGREGRSSDRDCRMSTEVPPSGSFLVQIRDNTYGGSELARYRLRIDPRPYATGHFPLGGVKGETVEVEVSGGSLLEPLRKSIRLPNSVGSTVDLGGVDGPGGPILAPGRLVVGDGPERSEPPRDVGEPPILLARGLTLNGRISQVGEVDRYRIAVKAGERVRIRSQASAMGSWLDSVIVVRDESGNVVAENDDQREAVRPDQARTFNAQGVPESSSDSLVEFESKREGEFTVEISDRFGEGGPEYGYRLIVDPGRPDFSVTLLVGNPNANPSETRGQLGVYNLKPGSKIPVNFLVARQGLTGPIEVRVEGLPAGVRAEPVLIREPAPDKSGATVVADFLEIKVSPQAAPGLSEFRVLATSQPDSGPSIVREATATVGVATVNLVNRPITRVVSKIPIRILGETPR